MDDVLWIDAIVNYLAALYQKFYQNQILGTYLNDLRSPKKRKETEHDQSLELSGRALRHRVIVHFVATRDDGNEINTVHDLDKEA